MINGEDVGRFLCQTKKYEAGFAGMYLTESRQL